MYHYTMNNYIIQYIVYKYNDVSEWKLIYNGQTVIKTTKKQIFKAVFPLFVYDWVDKWNKHRYLPILAYGLTLYLEYRIYNNNFRKLSNHHFRILFNHNLTENTV